MSSQAKIAVIGAGAIGKTHIDAIRSCPHAVLNAVIDPDPAAGTLAARDGASHLPDVAALLAHGCDGAIVATPNALHVPQALELISSGIPVLVEKPLADTYEAANELVTASKAAGVPGLTGHHRRYNAIIRAARRAISEGHFGTLVSGTILATLMKPNSYFDIQWRSQPGAGGPLLINLIHEIDLVRHLFGEIVEVTAMVSNARRKLEVEDTAAVVLKLEAGGLVTVSLTDCGVGPWCWDITAGENPARFPAMPAISHAFAGTEAGLSLPDLKLWRHDGALDWTVPQRFEALPQQPCDAYDAQISHFAAVIASRETPVASLEDGAANLRVIEAIRASVAEGKPKAIDPGAQTSPSGHERPKE